MGDGTKENPYTREDVLRLIEENGGKAEGLNLSEKVFEEGIDLSGKYSEEGINLTGAILNSAVLKKAVFDKCHLEKVRLIGANLEGAFLEETHLEDANLSHAHLENAQLVGTHLEKARLMGAHLEGAEFFDAHLEGATLINAFLDGTRLSGAHLQGVHLWGAKFSANTEMHSVDWGDYILGEEKEGEKEGQGHFLKLAEEIYRRLKVWYTNSGVYDTAAEFYYREMEAKRKFAQRRIYTQSRKSKGWKFIRFLLKERDLGNCIRLWIYKLICGYGEKPLRVIWWAISVIFVSAFIYFLIGSAWEWWAFWNSLYFSAVSFTALGYGSWLEISNDWIKGIGAFESFIGVFSIALFLITFVRKMTR